MLTMVAKNNKLWSIFRVLEVSMQILVFYIILCMLSYQMIINEPSGIVKCFLFTAFPTLLLYVARRFITNNVLMIMIHIGIMIFYIISGKTAEERLVYLLLGAALVIYSLSLNGEHKKDASEKIPLGFLCLFVVGNILGKSAGIESLTNAGIYGGSMFIVLHILYMNYSQVDKFLRMNQQIAGLPVQQIISVNTFLMFVLTTLFSGIVFICSNFYISRMIEIWGGLLGGGIKYVLRFIFSIGKDWESGGYVPTPNPEERGLMELHALMEESIWTDILNGIGLLMGSVLGITVLIGFCVGVLVIVSKKIKLMSLGEDSDIKEFVVPRDFAEWSFKRSKKKKEEKGIGTNTKIRKMYKNHVKRAAVQKRAVIAPVLMPYEISKLYVQRNAGWVTALYEKARYSDETVTQEEILHLKQELK